MNTLNKVHVFCPNGCNFTTASEAEPWDECAACGSRMTPEAEADFDRVHEQSEANQIDAFDDQGGRVLREDSWLEKDEMAIVVIP